MLPKRLKYYQAYDINFSNMAGTYANLLINNTGLEGGCSSSSCGSTTGSELASVFNGVLGSVADMVSASMMQNAAVRNNLAVQTGASLNQIAQAKAKVAGIEAQIKDVNSQLDIVNTQLTKAGEADAKIATLENEIAALKQANGVTENGPASESNLAKYEAAKSGIEACDNFITKQNTLQSNFDAASARFETAQNATYTTGGNKAIPIKLDSEGKADPGIQKSNYETKTMVDDGQGGKKEETSINTEAMQRDQAEVTRMETEFQSAKAAKERATRELNAHVNNMKDLPGEGESAEAKKASLEQQLADLSNQKTSSGDGAMTVAQYEAKLADLENQKAEYQQAKDNKTNLEAKKARLEKQLNGENGLETQLTKANGELTSLQSSFSSIGSDAQNVLKEKAEYDAARDMGANGKKRTGFQKFFGLNRSAEHKKQRTEYREAARAYTQTTGMDATNAQYQEALRRAGLLKDS